MRDLKGIKAAIALLAAAVVLSVAACGSITSLVLDGDWNLIELRAGDVIQDDLDEWTVVTFNNDDKTATFETGPEWPDGLDVTGTYAYEIKGGRNGTITLRDTDDDAIHSTITYELRSGASELRWIEWELQNGTKIVGEEETIRYILFERP